MIWIVGTGPMAQAYGKVLRDLKKDFLAIGRGEPKCQSFEKEFGVQTIRGGIAAFLRGKPNLPEAVIVAVGVEALLETVNELLRYGVIKILLEKPGIGSSGEISALLRAVRASNALVLLAYNRRFYASVRRAKEIILEDGGVTSFQFEFTEWSHVIGNAVVHPTEHNNWFLANSTHVIDTAFYLGGRPRELCCFRQGGVAWHPVSSIFSGAGISELGALFSYSANWEGPGRWSIDMVTKKHRLIFRPMETLQIQKIGSVAIEQVGIDDRLDREFKPGVHLQTRLFLENVYDGFCTVDEQEHNINHYYCRMSGYQ